MPYPLRQRIAILLGVLLGVIGPFMVPGQSEAASAAVAIGSTLDPVNLTVAPGTTVTWTNNDGERHRVRTTSGPEEFDSGNLETGESYSYTFAITGTYNYHDDRDDENPAYFGSVTVTATAPTTTTPPSTTQPPTDPPAPGPSGVSMINDSFSPRTLTVAAGTTVTWTNNDDDEHTATANDGSFASPTMVLGNTFSNTFNTAGTYDYFCIFHSGMTGTIVVTGGTTPTTTVPPSTTTTTTPPTTTPPAPGSGDVDIVDLAFSPASLTVSTGATVSWVNSGALPHTVTATDSSFDSGFMFTGDSYSRTFSSAGTFNYLCTLHPEMTGTITVTGTNTTPAPSGGGVDSSASLGSASGGSAVQSSGTTAPAGSISMLDNRYSPASRTVSAGTSVSWVNQGAVPHTVTGSNFDSGFLMPGDTYRRTFNNPGTYSYLCTIHPGMAGTITVTGAATGAADTDAVESGDGADDAVDPEALGDAETDGVDAGTSGDGAAQEELAISVVDLEFDPVDPKIFAGTKVIWTNDGELPHTATAADGSFDSGVFATGESFERVFAEPGTYAYLCTLHPGMEGSITVLEARAPADDAAAESESPEVLAAGISGVSGPLSPGGAIGLMAAAVAVIGVALAIGMARFGNSLSREEPRTS